MLEERLGERNEIGFNNMRVKRKREEEKRKLAVLVQHPSIERTSRKKENFKGTFEAVESQLGKEAAFHRSPDSTKSCYIYQEAQRERERTRSHMHCTNSLHIP